VAFGGSSTSRADAHDVGYYVTLVLERLGILNKGSAAAPAAPDPDEAGQATSISTNTLNVTRVGGSAALIASAGAAAIALFGVDKSKDPRVVVAAAYASVGIIVAAALITAGIIIAADIRSRTNVATSPSTGDPAAAKANVAVVRGAPSTQVTADCSYDEVLLDAVGGDVNITMPAANGCSGRMLTLSRIDRHSDHDVIVHGVSGHDGLALTAQRRSVRVYSTGSEWRSL
jgi:hypothetical protein